MSKSVAALILLVSLTILIAGCASTPQTLRYDSAGAVEQIVWPSPPEIPRYRFVGELTGEQNFFNDGEHKEPFVTRAFRWIVGLVAGERRPQILQRPQSGVVASDGRVFVTDVSRQALAVFDVREGKFIFWENAQEHTRFRTPIGVVEGKNNEILVTDSTLGYVVRLDPQGKPVGRFGEQELDHPTGIARDRARGLVYVADTHEHAIKIFNDDGIFLRAFGQKGEGDGQLNMPTHIAFTGDSLYVADTMNARIQVFDNKDKFTGTFGRRGLFIGNMPRPKGVAVDNNGLIYVVESYHDYLLIFNAKGEFLLPIGGSGQGIGQFYLPAGVWTDNNNKVYVADMFNGRVVVFEFMGETGHEG